MKKILSVLLITLVFSCNQKEEDFTSFVMTCDHYQFGDTYFEMEYSVVAPGRVSITDHGVEYKNIANTDSGRVSFGPLQHPRSEYRFIGGLQSSSSYKFNLYAVSAGKRFTTQAYSGATTNTTLP